MGYEDSSGRILRVLLDLKPRSCRELAALTGLSGKRVVCALYRLWRGGRVLRTKEPQYEGERVFRGRRGFSRNTRPFHLYVLRPEGEDSVSIAGRVFVKYSWEFLDPRGGGGLSKAQAVLDFLRERRDRAYYIIINMIVKKINSIPHILDKNGSRS